MFFKISFCSVYFAFIFLVQLIFVFSNFLPVQWNISTDVGHSSKERFYNYPMFTDIAPFDCDLTANSCDVGCCVDPDCSAEQMKIFRCSHGVGRCARPMSHYDCGCISERPNWFPMLCYIFENPIYLEWKERECSENRYRVDVPILSYLSADDSYLPYPHAMLGRGDKFRGFLQNCPGSVKYMRSERNNCFVRVSKELCRDGSVLGARSYLLAEKGNSDLKNFPFVFKNLESKEIADVDRYFKCASVGYYEYGLRETRHRYFYVQESLRKCDFDENLLDTFWDGNQCRNVLIRVEFEFITNISELVNVTSRFVLANISLSEKSPSEPENFVFDEESYVNRVHNVIFKDANQNEEKVEHDPVYNRGYYMGEKLNFGYKRTNGSQIGWERGHLGIFVNGRECGQWINVAFGYDSYAKCLHRSKTSNCSLLRESLAGIYDSLLRGDHLAPYSNFGPPYAALVPTLRNRDSDATQIDRNDSSTCLVPVRQDVTVQYATVRTVQGFLVHRAIGLFVDRTFDAVSSPDSITLTAQVAFYEVGPRENRRLSRFWQKVFSPEQSENAWTNLFGAFDRPLSGDELGDPTLWFLLAALALCLMMTFFRN